MQNNLKEIKALSIRGYHGRRHLLSIGRIHRSLSSRRRIKSIGKTIMKNIDNVRSDGLYLVPKEFPVLALQHVTSHEHAEQILESRSFKGRKHERPEFNDLSFWSADVSSDDIEKVRLKFYETIRTMEEPEDMERSPEEIKKQFANSPAFNKSASCYGNFKFSFPLSFLLCRYKTQHCNGGEPQLRILGTDVYKQEIAHYIVVHSPDTKVFNDLPIVRTIAAGPDRYSFVSKTDGTLFWRPESTSSSLHMKVSGGSRTLRPRRLCSQCVWNHLVLAFHLPRGGELNIPVRYLLKNLTPCYPLKLFMKKNKIQKHKAREMIQTFNERFLDSSSEDISQDSSQDISKDISQDSSQDNSQDISQDSSQDNSQDISQDISQDNSEDNSQDNSQDNSEDSSEEE